MCSRAPSGWTYSLHPQVNSETGSTGQRRKNEGFSRTKQAFCGERMNDGGGQSNIREIGGWSSICNVGIHSQLIFHVLDQFPAKWYMNNKLWIPMFTTKCDIVHHSRLQLWNVFHAFPSVWNFHLSFLLHFTHQLNISRSETLNQIWCILLANIVKKHKKALTLYTGALKSWAPIGFWWVSPNWVWLWGGPKKLVGVCELTYERFVRYGGCVHLSLLSIAVMVALSWKEPLLGRRWGYFCAGGGSPPYLWGWLWCSFLRSVCLLWCPQGYVSTPGLPGSIAPPLSVWSEAGG